MQKIILLIITVFLVMSCDKTKKDSNFQIDVTIKNVADGEKFYLKKQVDRKIIILDSTVVDNGKFSFKGVIKEPIQFGIFDANNRRDGIFPLVDLNDNIKITAYKDSLIKSIVLGSKLHDVLAKMSKKRERLGKKIQAYMPEYQKATFSNDSIKKIEINKKVKAISNKMNLNDWNFVKNNPNSYVSPIILKSLMTNVEYKDSINIVFNNFSDKIKNSELSKPIKEYFDKNNKTKQ